MQKLKWIIAFVLMVATIFSVGYYVTDPASSNDMTLFFVGAVGNAALIVATLMSFLWAKGMI